MLELVRERDFSGLRLKNTLKNHENKKHPDKHRKPYLRNVFLLLRPFVIRVIIHAGICTFLFRETYFVIVSALPIDVYGHKKNCFLFLSIPSSTGNRDCFFLEYTQRRFFSEGCR